jgi:hypothetical protein
MCNDLIDHKLLAKLAIHFSKTFYGLIDYGGKLFNIPERYPGNLYKILYSDINDYYHISDYIFLKSYLNLNYSDYNVFGGGFLYPPNDAEIKRFCNQFS